MKLVKIFNRRTTTELQQDDDDDEFSSGQSQSCKTDLFGVNVVVLKVY